MTNTDNSPGSNTGKTKRKKLPPEDVRSCTVTTKMTAGERQKIHAIAARCNLTPSDYMTVAVSIYSTSPTPLPE